MNLEDAKNSLRYMGISAGMEEVGLDKHIDAVIRLGIKALWYAEFWNFRQEDLELTVTETADWIALPDYVQAVGSVRQKGSTTGGIVRYAGQALFDQLIARPSNVTAGYPVMWTGKLRENDGVLMMRFFPMPSVTTLYLTIYRHAPDKIDKVPAIADAALMACMERHLYPKRAEFSQAIFEARNNQKVEIRDLLRADRLSGRPVVRALNPGDMGSLGDFAKRPWEV